MNRAEFYKHLRKRDTRTFGTSLSQRQVDGLEAILDAGQGYPLARLAYGLGTARGEVGSGMQPVEENLSYSAGRIPQVFSKSRLQGIPAQKLARNPKGLANTVYGGKWGEKNLGNVKDGDGWRYRGRGYPQTTGRRNYQKLSVMAGVDLINRPERMMEPEIAGIALFHAMDLGIYTGKAFRHYLPDSGPATFAQFKQARRIINGQFHADKIARFAVDFQDALIAAGFSPDAPDVPINEPAQPNLTPQEPRPSIWAALFAAIAKLFGGKTT